MMETSQTRVLLLESCMWTALGNKAILVKVWEI